MKKITNSAIAFIFLVSATAIAENEISPHFEHCHCEAFQSAYQCNNDNLQMYQSIGTSYNPGMLLLQVLGRFMSEQQCNDDIAIRVREHGCPGVE